MSRFRKESTVPEKTGTVREKSGNGWLRNHWCALSLCIIVIVAFALRTVFAYGISADGDFALSGGSSAQYHLHIVESILNGSYAMNDPAVNYPIGGLNVYPPLMDYIAAGIASILTATGMGVTEAASAALASINPVIGALTCIPVFLVAREMFDRRIGIVAALVFAFLALPISTTVFSSGTEYGLAAFFVAFMSWFAVRMVKAADAESASRKSILVNAALTGIFLALAALTWNGFRVIVVMLVVAMVIQIVVDRLRGRDFTNVLLGYIVAILVGVLIPAAYYVPAGLMDAVYSGPIIIAVLSIVFSLVFMVLRSKPWVITIPALVVVFVIVAAALALATPDLFNDIFVGNSIYANSIMDQLASNYVSMSNVAAYYGWLTMWLPICYAIYSLYVYCRRDHSATRLFITVWMFAMFFAVWTSYANAAVVGTVFAVGSAIVIVRVLEQAKLREWVANMKSAGFPGAFRKLIKPFPLASVLVVALLIVVPNVSFAVDAGISNNSDADYYFSGNTQYTIKTGDDYPIGDLWDEYADVPKDGALATWIDYTYDSVSQGGFQTVTDTVGGGTSAVSHMYLAEGAGGSVAAMLLRIMMANDPNDFQSCFTNADVFNTVKGYIQDPASAVAVINDNPSVYGNVRTDITDENAVYLASIECILENMSEVEIMQAYDAVCKASGDKIGYIYADASMLPLQYGDGSTFSTIAYFGDYSVDRYGAATEFYSYNTYSGVTVYTDAIYDTFLWKAMIGPSAAEAGYSSSYNYLVALSSSDGSDGSAKGIPGYGLAGFEVVFWQVMYNPDSDAAVTDDGWEYMNGYDAIAKQKAEGGAINYLSSMVMLHYTGVPADSGTLEGTVSTGEAPVDGATVSVYQYSDVYGQYVLFSETTTRDGAYTVMVPTGDYRVSVSIGDVVLQTSTSSNLNPDIVVDTTSVTGSVTVGDDVYNADLMLSLSSDAVKEMEVRISGGVISIPDILPGTYSYTLYDATGTSIGTGSVTVYPGENVGFTVSPTVRTITVTVNDVFGNPATSGRVVATNTTTGAQFGADVKDGTAVISAVSGQYNLSMGEGFVTMYTSTVNVSSSNRTATITAYPAETVTVQNAPEGIILTVSAGTFTTVSYVSDGDLKFDVPRSPGTDAMLYTVYGVSGGSVYLGAYTGCPEEAKTYDIGAPADAVTVSGQLKDGENGKAGTVQFIGSNNTTVSVSTDSDGNFTALLPAGSYTVAANNGSDKVYVGKAQIDSDNKDMNLDLVDGRRISYTLRYDRGTNATNAYVPFVLGMIQFTYNEQDYTLYGMTNTSGAVSFYIPDQIESTISLNNAEGTLDNDAFMCTDMTRDVSAGASNNSSTVTINVYDAEDVPDNYVKPVDVTAEYTMTVHHYEDEDDVEETLEAGTTYQLRPGQYTVTIEGSTGYYFDGTMYIYPGDSTVYGIEDVQQVVTVNVTDGENDVVSIKTEEGSYHKFDGGYYLEVGHKYYLTSTNTVKVTAENGTSKDVGSIAYGYLDLTDVTEGTYAIDMTASQAKMEIKGNVGIVADGTVTVSYQYREMAVEHQFDVTDGAFTMTLPVDVTSVDVSVEVTATIDSEDYYYATDGTFSGLKDGEIRNIPVVSSEAPAADEDEEDAPGFTAELGAVSMADGTLTAEVTIHNASEKDMTYQITSGDAMVLDRAYSINVAAGADVTVTVTGYYDAGRVAPGADGLELTVKDINGKDSETLEILTGTEVSGTEDVEILIATDDDSRAASNSVSAYQYMYAVTIVNNNIYSHQAVINVNAVEGWTITIMDEDGKTILNPGEAFTVYGLQTTVLYVKVMLNQATSDDAEITVPAVHADVTVGSESRSVDLSAGEVNISTGDMSASGDNIFNERSGVPGGIWFLIAVIILLLVATFWLASKRGVFSRRN